MSRNITAALTTDQFEYLLDLPGGVSVQGVSVDGDEVVLRLSVEDGTAGDWSGEVSLEYSDDGEGHLLLTGVRDALSP